MKKRTIFYILIVFALLFTACGKKPQTWQELYDLGEKYLLEENYEEAIVAFQKAIELDGKEIQAYTGLIRVYQNIGNYDYADEKIHAGLSILKDVNADETISNEMKENQISFLEAAKATYIAINDKEKLYEILQMLLELEPENKDYQRALATISYPEGYYTSSLCEELNKEYKEKLKYLYELYKDSSTDAVIEYLKENLDYFLLEGREDAVHINGFIETEFYYGAKVYYGDTDELGRPSGTGIALCDDHGFTGFWIYMGEWLNGRRQGSGSYFMINKVGEIMLYDGDWDIDRPKGNGNSYYDAYYGGESKVLNGYTLGGFDE